MDTNLFRPLSDYKTVLRAYLGYTPRNQDLIEKIIQICFDLGWTQEEIEASPHRAIQIAQKSLNSDILLSPYLEWT